MKNHVEEMRFEKLKNSIEKEERIFMRQHGFAAKKYEKSAAETREAMLIKAHVQRRKTMIQLNPPITQPDFNRRMTKLTLLDPTSLRHLQELEYKREQKKELIKKRWRKSLIIAKFNLEHKRIRQQQLTLKLTGDKSLRFEERILQKQQEESPMTDVQKFHRRFTRQSIATRTSDFDKILKIIQEKEETERKLKKREESLNDGNAWSEAQEAYYIRSQTT